jgi:hypothetical protein
MRQLVPLLALAAAPTVGLADAELGGSPASMRHQYRVAKAQDIAFLRTPADVRRHVSSDRLELVASNEHIFVNKVSFPYARPAVKLFIERLAAQYHRATGERLVVTSLTRPVTRQPRNAHRLSVHPAGLALDLRVPRDAAHREWLEETLLSLESSGVLDVTRERRPPHYHVAVFPDQYEEYVAPLIAREAERKAMDEKQKMAIRAATQEDNPEGDVARNADVRNAGVGNAGALLFVLAAAILCGGRAVASARS